MGGAAAAESDGGVIGPSEVDPFALMWSDQRANILRGFLFLRGDDGVEFEVGTLADKSHAELVAMCEQAQRARRINRPWLRLVAELWEGSTEADAAGLWDVGTLDSRALKELQKKEDELSKKAGLRRSQSPRARVTGNKAVPAKKNDGWDEDDDWLDDWEERREETWRGFAEQGQLKDALGS